MRLIEALARGSICCMLAAGCRMGYEDAATLRHAAGNTAGSGASTSGATGGGSGAAGTMQPAGAGDPGTPPGSGGDGASTGGGTDGSAGGASGDTGTQGNGGTTASGGMGGSAAASDVGGAAGDALGGSGATGGTSASGGAGGTTATGGSSGLGGGGGYAGASSLGDCTSASYGGRDYLFCNVKVIWEQARDNCASIGMALARVDDAGEDQFLSDNAYTTPPITGIWLGANDTLVEGEWRWLDGELFWLGAKTGSAQNGLYDGWFVGTQPSGQQPERDCAVHNIGSSPGWYDSDCTISKEYVCEAP